MGEEDKTGGDFIVIITIKTTIFSLYFVPGAGSAFCIGPFNSHRNARKVGGSIIPIFQKNKVSLKKVK